MRIKLDDDNHGYWIKNRGFVLTGTVTVGEPEIGDVISLTARIAGIETFNGHKSKGAQIGLLLKGWKQGERANLVELEVNHIKVLVPADDVEDFLVGIQ